MEAVQTVAVLGSYQHEVVKLPRYHMAFHATGHLLLRGFEGCEDIRRPAVQHHADQHHPCIERLIVQQRDNVPDLARLLEAFDSSQAGPRAQLHLPASATLEIAASQ